MLEKIIQGKGGNLNIKNSKCENCEVITGQLNYTKNELINAMNEIEELTKYKEELCNDIKNKNEEIVKFNDIIQNMDFQVQGYKEENTNIFNEIYINIYWYN